MGLPVQITGLNTVVTFLSLFMTLFMLVSAFITDKLFIGPAPVAFLIGIIFGPRSAALLDPLGWRNYNAIILEFSRIVLAIQSFGNAVTLPKYYPKRHWVSLAYIIGPVMLGGWLITTCFVKVMAPFFEWKQCLATAATFNAIDPVLAATILDYSFTKRIPKHMRDLLRYEAAANGLTTTIVLGLTSNLMKYPNAKTIVVRTLFVAMFYESIFSTVSGFVIGYMARRILRKAESRGMIDRPSFLAFYVSVALFGTGLGTTIGVDEVNLAFFAGIGLDNDSWYERRVKRTYFSSSLDLFFNLGYFVFIGSLVPWSSFHSSTIGLLPWRLVIGALCIFLFRRIPMVLLLKEFIPDLKTWREAAFYGHFGPIGAGAIFSALLLRGSLTPGSNRDVNNVASNAEEKFLDQLWAIVNFVVLCSCVVHGTSIAVFFIGRKVQTVALTLTMSHTSENTGSSDNSWMNRLPRVIPRSRSTSLSSSSRDIERPPELTHPTSTIPWQTDNLNPSLQFIHRTHSSGSDNLFRNSSTVPAVRVPVHAYRYRQSIIIEDEDGDIIRTYKIPRKQCKNQPSESGDNSTIKPPEDSDEISEDSNMQNFSKDTKLSRSDSKGKGRDIGRHGNSNHYRGTTHSSHSVSWSDKQSHSAEREAETEYFCNEEARLKVPANVERERSSSFSSSASSTGSRRVHFE